QSNIITLNTVNKFLMRDEASIEGQFTTNNSNSDSGGKTKDQTNPNSTNEGFEKYLRRSNLEFISEYDRLNHSLQYDKISKPEVWIVSHGWCDSRDSFKPIASEIKKVYPEALVFTFDWSEASFNDCGTCGLGNCPMGVKRAATWIEPTAQKLKEKLNDWGFNDGNKLRVVGHSLGSILSSELSYKLPNKAAKLIALDPPAENYLMRNNITGIYHTAGNFVINSRVPLGDEKDNEWYEKQPIIPYKVNESRERRTFTFDSQSSKAFYGKHSFAGNRQYASTAHESYEIDYGYSTYFMDAGAEHQNVVKTFTRMIKDIDFRDEQTKQQRVLNLEDVWKDHSQRFIREKGKKGTDNGELEGIRENSLNHMWVKESILGFQTDNKYIKTN
ncbi:MAG: hypothetical protein ACRCXZ_01195, partial [Patescibacteria group bacterium]